MNIFKRRLRSDFSKPQAACVTFERLDPQSLNDYVVFDLETTGFSRDAEIIEFGAIKVENGRVVSQFDTLVKPKIEIPTAVSKITHITNDMVLNSPGIETAFLDFFSFIQGSPLVGYNISSYDLPIIKKLLESYISEDVFFSFFDVIDLARNKLSHLPDKKLVTIAPYLGIVPENAHRATADCITTKLCFEKLLSYSCNDNSNNVVPSTSYKGLATLSDSTNSLRELQMFLSGIIADNIVTEEEVLHLYSWLEANNGLKGQFPYDRVLNAVMKVLEDGIVTGEESEELRSLFEIFIDPVNSKANSSNCSVCNKTFVLTGDFNYSEKSEIENLITSSGGIVKTGVSKKVDYVAVGSLGSPQWCNGNYGTKIKRALELQSEGCPICVITEEQLLNSLGLG